jgi:hypothetical protein
MLTSELGSRPGSIALTSSFGTIPEDVGCAWNEVNGVNNVAVNVKTVSMAIEIEIEIEVRSDAAPIPSPRNLHHLRGDRSNAPRGRGGERRDAAPESESSLDRDDLDPARQRPIQTRPRERQRRIEQVEADGVRTRAQAQIDPAFRIRREARRVQLAGLPDQ